MLSCCPGHANLRPTLGDHVARHADETAEKLGAGYGATDNALGGTCPGGGLRLPDPESRQTHRFPPYLSAIVRARGRST